jgi:hypothetical protein
LYNECACFFNVPHLRNGHVYVCICHSLLVELSSISCFACGSIPWVLLFVFFLLLIHYPALHAHAGYFVLPSLPSSLVWIYFHRTPISFQRNMQVVCSLSCGRLAAVGLALRLQFTSRPNYNDNFVFASALSLLDRSNLCPLTTWFFFFIIFFVLDAPLPVSCAISPPHTLHTLYSFSF